MNTAAAFHILFGHMLCSLLCGDKKKTDVCKAAVLYSSLSGNCRLLRIITSVYHFQASMIREAMCLLPRKPTGVVQPMHHLSVHFFTDPPVLLCL